jgi:hypothetical protein
MISMMKALITNKDTRLEIVNNMSDFIDNNYNKCQEMIKLQITNPKIL